MKVRFTLNILAVICLTLMVTSFAHAQASRTWVSGVGDDANPCSRTAPCKTFPGAISKTADGGEIDCIDSGGFGTVTITKSITIDGAGTLASILAAGTNGVNVNDSSSGAPGSKVVVIRNISINGFGTGLVGISITSAKTVHVENVEIFGFGAGSGRGINDTRTLSGNLFVKDSFIRNNLGSGIVVIPSSGTPTLQAVVDNVRLEQNGTSVGTGFVIAGANVRGSISRSEISKSPSFGLQSDLSSKMSVDHCVITFNAAGVDASGGSEMRIANSVVTLNTGTNVTGNVLSYGNNMLRSNGTDNVPTIQGQQ